MIGWIDAADPVMVEVVVELHRCHRLRKLEQNGLNLGRHDPARVVQNRLS